MARIWNFIDGYYFGPTKEELLTEIESDLRVLFEKHKIKQKVVKDIVDKIYTEYCIKDIIE